MLKKSAIAASLIMFAGSAFALDGGQLDFSGLVSDNTCALHVNGGAQDGQIILQTATSAEVTTAGMVKNTTAGAQPEDFSITVDCSAGTPPAKAFLNMGSVDSIGQRNSYVKTWGCGGFLNETNIYSRGKSLCF